LLLLTCVGGYILFLKESLW